MFLKTTYKLQYLINKEPEELIVEVQLKMIDGELKRNQNIYYGIVLIDGILKKDYDLRTCVNTKSKAEEIGLMMKQELIEKYKKEKKTFRIKKEIIL